MMLVRFFLGVTEGAVSPGFVVLTSIWWKKSEHPNRLGRLHHFFPVLPAKLCYMYSRLRVRERICPDRWRTPSLRMWLHHRCHHCGLANFNAHRRGCHPDPRNHPHDNRSKGARERLVLDPGGEGMCSAESSERARIGTAQGMEE